MRIVALVLAVMAAACVEGIDPEWQLDHDRVVAVRTSAAHIAAGETAAVDGLIAHKGAPTDVEAPLGMIVYAPHDFDDAVTGPAQVTAPSADRLAAERTALGLDAGAPVPLILAMEFPDSNGIHLLAKKTIYLGDSVPNAASVGTVVIGDAPPPAPGEMITFPIDVDVPMSVDAPDDADVMWLTSCGTMHDDDEHAAFVHVEKDDPKEGELVLVVRAADGGVVWQVWPAVAQ